MLFTTVLFVIFFIVVFFVYYFLFNEKTKAQNWLLLIASYVFYGFASWKMIPILLAITIIFYFLGIVIHRVKTVKSSTLFKTIGVFAGVLILLYFKYLNFFIDSFATVFNTVGLQANWGTFNILMPLGVSYFTFKLISYVIEVYLRKMEPCTDFVAFATYVAFFPTIMAGPIDRPTTFIPQLLSKRSFDYNGIVKGLRRILWGVFMKVALADRLAIYINAVYANIPQHNGTTLAFAIFLYPFQMYADFSGYSEMAIGIGKVLGFNVTENFKRPFFATNIAEFWRRWHISLTSWVTDYVFMPLNVRFRNWGKIGIILAIIINMIVIGFWHGANWTYGVFGLYQGLLFIPLILSGSFFNNTKQKKFELPKLVDYTKMLGIFFLMAFGMMIFRVTNVNEAFIVSKKILMEHGSLYIGSPSVLIYSFFCLLLLLIKDFAEEFFPSKLLLFENKHKSIRVLAYSSIIILILLIGIFDGGQFIYFQF